MKVLAILVPILLIAALAGCTETFPTEATETEAEILAQSAKQPFVGHNSTLFNPGFFLDFTKPTGYGTFVVEGADDVEYGQVFYSLGTGKPFGDPATGNAFHSAERFEIYTWIDFDVSTQTLSTGDLLMTGVSTGVSVHGVEFKAHGRILEAYGPFEGLAGRPSSSSATVTWGSSGLPYSSSGVIKVPW